MIILGTEPLGESTLGGFIVTLGAAKPPYTPDYEYATKEDFKATFGTSSDGNYLVYAGSEGYVPEDDSCWNPYNTDDIYTFDVTLYKTFLRRMIDMENSAKHPYPIDVSGGDWVREDQPGGAGIFARGRIECNGQSGSVVFVMGGVEFTRSISADAPVMFTPDTVLQAGTTATGLVFVA